MARDVSLEESVGSVSMLAFIVEVGIAIRIGWTNTQKQSVERDG